MKIFNPIMMNRKKYQYLTFMANIKKFFYTQKKELRDENPERIENENPGSIGNLFFKAIKEREIAIPNSTPKDQSYIFPWGDVIACKDLVLSPDSTRKLGTVICKCGNKAFWMYFKSSPYTWENLMGREGYLSICPHCIKQIKFICTVMN